MRADRVRGIRPQTGGPTSREDQDTFFPHVGLAPAANSGHHVTMQLPSRRRGITPGVTHDGPANAP